MVNQEPGGDMSTFLRFRDLKARGIVDNRTTLQRWIQQQQFPPGRLLGPNVRAWSDREISVWLSSRPLRRTDFARDPGDEQQQPAA
jgi:predicted DNA-binding transcriptional regulator AlpA